MLRRGGVRPGVRLPDGGHGHRRDLRVDADRTLQDTFLAIGYWGWDDAVLCACLDRVVGTSGCSGIRRRSALVTTPERRRGEELRLHEQEAQDREESGGLARRAHTRKYRTRREQ
jgi:hypothetical protein